MVQVTLKFSYQFVNKYKFIHLYVQTLSFLVKYLDLKILLRFPYLVEKLVIFCKCKRSNI